MMIRKAFIGILGAIPALAGVPSGLNAAQLWVYALNVPTVGYVYNPPYITWSPAEIQANMNGWVPADQILAIQTDEKYHAGAPWYIQIFSDNTQVANAKTVFNVPDNDLYSGTTHGPVSTLYTSTQTITVYTTCQDQWPKSGLISADGRERIPLIWRVYDALPPGNLVPAITEIPKPTGVRCDTNYTQCDFQDCSWFYLLDKGDINVNAGALSWAWQDGAQYVTPMTIDGTQSVVGTRWPPTLVDGWNEGYIYFAANFRNASRQMYSTTLFVELVEM